MAQNVTKTFESYTLSYRSGHPQMEARIYCFQGTTRVGTIDFIKEGTRIPSNSYDPSVGGWGIFIYFALTRFKDVLTILQYEKPLMLYFTPDTLDAGIITTEYEPVGEQEL